jgi:hypothetical protein
MSFGAERQPLAQISPMDWATFNLAVGAALAVMILAR